MRLLVIGLVALTASTCSPRPIPAPGPAPRPIADSLDRDARRWVDGTLAGLTLRQAVAQMIIPWIPGSYASESDPEFLELADWVRQGLGGVSISIGVPDAYVAKLNRLQEIAAVPLLVTADFENGGPGMRINHSYAIPSLLPQGGGTSFPPTMAFGAAGDERYAFEYGRITATEARAVGVHWLFAPVLDVNSNPENPVINTRSFGGEPEAVGRLGAAFVRGAREGGALTTAKHFPGHGDTRTDSHIELPVVAADRERLDRLELVPFRMAVAAGVDAVMTAHVAVPQVLGDERPATLSPYFMTELLREDMGFGGILFTDALRMAAITDGFGAGEAGVLAVEAGSDVLLAPADIGATVDALVNAVSSGRVSRERIDQSVRRLLEAKARLGLHEERRVDPANVAEQVGVAAHLDLADEVAARSITLVRDREGALPLRNPGRVLSVTYGRPGNLLAGVTFNASLRSLVPRVSSARVGPDTPWPVYDSLLAAAGEADHVLIGAYMPPRSGTGSIGVPPELQAFVSELAAGAAPVAVVSFGSPYLLSAFPDLGTYLIAWGDREVSQRAAARAVAGAAAVGGRLPIPIPPFHTVGEGLDRAALPHVVALEETVIDPLREAGFIPGEGGGAESGAEEAAEPTGGPGRWVREEALPECGDWRPAGALEPWSSNGKVDLADAFCRRDEAAVSRREVDPARVGMSPDSLNALDGFVRAALADSAASGAALAVVRRGQLVRLRGYGRQDWDPSAPPVTPASIFDLASLTKVVGTTTAAMILAQRGVLDLDRPVVDYLPWWADGDPAKSAVTVRQLLVHQGGLPPFRRFFLEMEGREAYERAIGALPLDHSPGDTTVYSDIGLMTVGFAVEAVTGRTLDGFLSAEVWGPLGMSDTGFQPDPARWHRVVTTELDESYRGIHVHGVVHDENAYAIGGVAGHAGLFSSARDLAVFAQMLLDRGVAGPCRADGGSGLPCHRPRFRPVSILGPGWVDRITRPQSASSSRALGWDTPAERSSAGDYFTARAFGHTGYTGTSIWMDPVLDVAVVLLTNRVNPTRENSRHVALRRGVHDRVARAIVDQVVVPRAR